MLVSRGEVTSGSYKHTDSQDYYGFENSCYASQDMIEIKTNSPAHTSNNNYNIHAHTSNNNYNSHKDLHQDADQALSFYASVPSHDHATQEASLDFAPEVSSTNPVVKANGGAAFGDSDVTEGGAVYSLDHDDDIKPDQSPPAWNRGGNLRTVIAVGGSEADVYYPVQPPGEGGSSPKKTVGFHVDVKDEEEDEDYPPPPPPLLSQLQSPPEVVHGESFSDPAFSAEALSGSVDIYIPDRKRTEQSASMAFAVE